jgi:hypothetical protein
MPLTAASLAAGTYFFTSSDQSWTTVMPQLLSCLSA